MKYHIEYEFWGAKCHVEFTDKDVYEREYERVIDDPNILNHTIKTYETTI